MTTDASLLDLILNASLLVQLVMLILLLASIVSWTMIFNKRKLLKYARKQADMFEERFWSGTDLTNLHVPQNPVCHRLASRAGWRSCRYAGREPRRVS